MKKRFRIARASRARLQANGGKISLVSAERRMVGKVRLEISFVDDGQLREIVKLPDIVRTQSHRLPSPAVKWDVFPCSAIKGEQPLLLQMVQLGATGSFNSRAFRRRRILIG